MDTNIRKPLQTALSRLTSEKAQIDKRISAIQAVLELEDGRQDGVAAPAQPQRKRQQPRRAGRKPMSAAARKAVGRRMKAYWAKRRTAKGRRKAS
jgi:hypothetical protein